MTKELKRDLQLLHMRNVLDPKRHFRKEGKKLKSPEFSQVGTVIEGATEYFSARVPRKQRSQTLAAGLLSDKKMKRHFEAKYGEIQTLRTSGKKAFSKSQKSKGVRGRR